MPKFKPGQSGNPRGRPRGLTTAQKLREQISKDIGDVIAVVRRQALAGDMQAAKLLLERCVPTLKPQASSLPMALPVNGALLALKAAVLAGDIAPDTADQVVGILLKRENDADEQRKIVITIDE